METPTFRGENPRIHLLEFVLTYVKKGKYTLLEVEIHLPNKMWCSWQCLSSFSMKNIKNITNLNPYNYFPSCTSPGRLIFLFLVCNLDFFYIFLQRCYGALLISPSTDKTSTVHHSDYWWKYTFFFCLFMVNFPKIHFPQKPWLLCLCRGLLPLYKNKVHEFKRIISPLINYTPFAPVLGNRSHRHFLGLIKCNVAKETVIQLGDKSEVTRHTPAHLPPFFKDLLKNYEINWLGLV